MSESFMKIVPAVFAPHHVRLSMRLSMCVIVVSPYWGDTTLGGGGVNGKLDRYRSEK